MLGIGNVIKTTTLIGLLTAIIIIGKANLNKLGEMFQDGSAVGITATETFAQSLSQIKQLIDQRSDGSEYGEFSDGEETDGRYTQQSMGQLLNLMGNDGIFSNDDELSDDGEQVQVGSVIQDVLDQIRGLLDKFLPDNGSSDDEADEGDEGYDD